MTIRVVLAEDNLLVREGIRRVLDMHDGVEVVAACEDLQSLLDAVADAEPDVVVTDIRMPPTGTDEGIQAADRLREERPGVGVVVLSHYAEPGYATALLEHGTAGRAYLLKDRVSDPGQLVAAIREVHAGGSVIDPHVVDTLVAARARERASPLQRLTPRELDVLGEMAQGKSNAAIADTLDLSERAVEKHINSLLAKLDLPPEPEAHRRVKAVLVFLQEQG